MFQAFDRGGRDEVAALYDSPPVSTRQVLQGYGAPPPGGEPWVEPELAVPRLEAFPTLLSAAQYGAYAFETALRHWDRDVDAIGLTAGLRADQLSVLRDEEGEVAAAWRLRFVDEDAAERANRAVRVGLSESGRRAAVGRVDRDVLVLAASNEALAEVELTSLAWDPVPAEREPEADEARVRRRSLCVRR